MSGSQTEEITINRRPRGDRPERQVHREDPPAMHVEVDGGGADPVEALAESQRILKEHETRLANEQRLRLDAERRATAATQGAAARQHADRQTLASSTIAAAESDIAVARAAYYSARESADLVAETEAQVRLSAASSRLDRATAELEWLKSQQPATPQPQAQPNNGQPTVSAETQAWLDAHPAYHSDDEYQALAQFAHGKALSAGHKSGSQSYVDFIDKYLEGKFGEGHGQVGGAKPVTRERGGELTPTRRTQSSSTGGYKTAKVGNLGNIQYVDTADGRRVKMSREMSDICKEGAEVCRMSLEEYVNDQILIAQEIEAGGSGDIIYGDGKRNT